MVTYTEPKLCESELLPLDLDTVRWFALDQMSDLDYPCNVAMRKPRGCSFRSHVAIFKLGPLEVGPLSLGHWAWASPNPLRLSGFSI